MTSCLLLLFLREESEEYNIPEGEGNLPDLLQPARSPIYDEPGVRVVELNRERDSGLGISIVGGKVDPGGVGLKGIFIRHVLESSPAARLGTLVTGDQILEVRLLIFEKLQNCFFFSLLQRGVEIDVRVALTDFSVTSLSLPLLGGWIRSSRRFS